MGRIAPASLIPNSHGAFGRPLAVILLACGALGAAETKIRDLRLIGGSTPETDTPDITYASSVRGEAVTNFVDEDKAKLAIGPRVGVGMVESFGTIGAAGGFILGLDYSYSKQRSANTAHSPVWTVAPPADATQTGPIESNVNAFDLELGWALPMSRWFHLEIAAFGGIGSLTIDDDGPNYGPAGHVNGPYREFGGRAGLFWTTGGGFQLGFEAGYLVSHGRSALRYDEYDGTGAVVGALDVIYEIDQSGPFGALTIGVRF